MKAFAFVILFVSFIGSSQINYTLDKISGEKFVCYDSSQQFISKTYCFNANLFGTNKCFGNFYSPSENKNYSYSSHLIQLAGPNAGIIKTDKFCFEVTFTSEAIYSFQMNLNRVELNGVNSSVLSGCSLTDTILTFNVLVSSSYCKINENNNCNLITNKNFENPTTCPSPINHYINFSQLDGWSNCSSNQYSNGYYFNNCGNYIGYSSNNLFDNLGFPNLPAPSGEGYIGIHGSQSIGTFVDLCAGQRYKVSAWISQSSSRFNLQNKNINIFVGNTASFPLSNTACPPTGFNLVGQFEGDSIWYFVDWRKYEFEFTATQNTNALIIQGDCSGVMDGLYLDDFEVIPIDTLQMSLNPIATSCDSIEFIVNIPGCYGPYDIQISINQDTLGYHQINDGHSIKLPNKGTYNYIEVMSVTNRNGCNTVLGVKDTIINDYSSRGDFISTDICEGGVNSITILQDTGFFSFASTYTDSGLFINPETGIITNGSAGAIYVIRHVACHDTVLDTVQVISANSAFTSSDFCEGQSNQVILQGTSNGLFSFNPMPVDGATINPNTGVIFNAVAGSSYFVQYTLTGQCPDTAIQEVYVIPSQANFTSTDICEGMTNTINFPHGNTGLFSYNGTDSSYIDSLTGKIYHGIPNTTYIIKHELIGSCYDEAYDTVYVVPSNASFSSTTICEASVNQVQITGTYGGVFDFVTPPNDGAVINNSNGKISNGVAGVSYTIMYSLAGQCPDTSYQIVSVIPKDDASFSTSNFCKNEKNQVQILGTQGGVFSLFPNVNDAAIIDSLSGVIFHSTAGNSYSIRYITPNQCPDTSTAIVQSLVVPSVQLSGGGDLCVQNPVTIDFSFQGIPNWSMIIDNGIKLDTITGINSPVYQLQTTQKGMYSVKVLSDAQCKSDTNNSFVIVKGDSVSFSVDNSIGCMPQEVNFTSNIVDVSADCIWDFGDGSTSSQCGTVSHIYQYPGCFDVTLSVNSSVCGGVKKENDIVCVYVKPTSQFYPVNFELTTLNSKTLFSNTSRDAENYWWFIDDSLRSIDENFEFKFPNKVAEYDVCLVAVTQQNCVDTSCRLIEVEDEYKLFIPNAFTPNDDGLNDVFAPVITNVVDYELKIFNRWGQLIFESEDPLKGWDGRFKSKISEPGVYLWKMAFIKKNEFDINRLSGHVTITN